MARTGLGGLVVSVLLVAVLVASAGAVQRVRDGRYPEAAAAEESLYVTSGRAARGLSIGFQALAADVYWIRAIQHYGGVKRRLSDPSATVPASVPAGGAAGETANAYPLLYPLLDLTTTLDPKFNIAYRFGAIFLAEPFPGGAGRPDLALALLEKGLKEKADKWEYMQDAGFVHYWWRQDYKAAAEWFDRASRVPGAPWWLRSLAAHTLTEGGDRRSSRLMWQTIRETAEIEWLKNDAERRLGQLQALDDIDALQRVVDQAAALGVTPMTWSSLVQRRLLRGVPGDPTGVPYQIAEGRRVQLSPSSSLHPLLREPERLVPLP
jgi:hypothetical protein